MREEDRIQADIVAYLRLVLPGALVFAIPNAARRTRGGRAANAVPGLMPGVPDLCIVADERPAFLETKTTAKTSRLSKPQRDILTAMDGLGVRCGVARSIDEARAALARWGIKTREK